MVKTEENPLAAAQAAYPHTWSSAIPIDPALQQQQPQTQGHYYQYAHYANAYPTQYQYTTTATPQTVPAATVASTSTANAPTKNDSADVDALHDALGSAGVDLRAEAESLQRASDAPTRAPHADRARKQPATPSFNEHFLGTTVRALSTHHKLARVPDDAVSYLALALRARLAGLVQRMAAASAHRTDTTFDRPASLYTSGEGEGEPMWGLAIRADVAKQLSALERAERDDETRVRRERKERADAHAAHAAHLAAQSAAASATPLSGGDEDEEGGGPRKKKKKEAPPPKVTGEMHTKMANVTANQAAGLTAKYAWMSAGAGGGAAKSKAAAGAAAGSAAPAAAAAAAGTSSWAKPYQSATKPLVGPGSTGVAQGQQAGQQAQVQKEDTRRAITLRDALFVVEKERGHGAGKGAARGWV